jgi:quercetin dioxygenase-like cupin family protein
MKLATQAALAATGVLILATATPASAQTAAQHPSDHIVVTPGDIRWAAAPPVLPRAQAAVLYGDPTKPGPFAMRLRLPANYSIPPHTHPMAEVVTVISGTFRLGSGNTADKDKVQALPAGSFFAFPPGSAHYAFNDEETIVQITSVGPWGISFVNPADDPRKQ